MADEPKNGAEKTVAAQGAAEESHSRFAALLLRRLLLSAALLAWLLTMALLCLIGPALHQSYRELCRASGAELPGLAENVALPVLGPPIGLIDYQQPNPWIRYVYWGFVFLPPLVMGACVWRIRDPRRLTEVWVYFATIYFTSFACSVVLIALFLCSTFFFI